MTVCFLAFADRGVDIKIFCSGFLLLKMLTVFQIFYHFKVMTEQFHFADSIIDG